MRSDFLKKNQNAPRPSVWAWFRQTNLFWYTVCSSMRGGETKFKLPKAENGNVFFLQAGEICKSRQSCSSTVPPPAKHRHQRMWRFYPRHCRSMNTSTGMRYSNNFCTLLTELQTGAAPMLLWFADCRNSTGFKLAPPGIRGSLGLE